ncbi:hypothetical protein OKA05_06425 [Luteolibacter arcticus]|uniref:C2H2-type domain-containing protein n=1 Tax=Luteolibacter arcticus TaxID=1581411 RepID=A0ABT3GEY9_9BACT|nr:hypothetical protein [Luteolibacter arcticus]MCW1922180.1 hypothetical protein [Luteolibacter arcticus]
MKADPVVRCADDLRAVYPKPSFWLGLAFIAVFLVFQLIAEWLDWQWLRVVPFVLFLIFVLPVVMRLQRDYQRVINALECPHCGQAAGKTFTKQGILHLRCQHCGKETRTDSLVLYQGPPTKI